MACVCNIFVMILVTYFCQLNDITIHDDIYVENSNE